MSRPKLYMLVGVPGSGKSTWVNQYVDFRSHDNLYIASTDDIIEGIALVDGKTYNEVFKDNIKAAEKQMYENVMDATSRDLDIIWDQTNLTRKSRAKKLIMIPDHYEKIGVLFPTPDDLWERLLNREGASGKSIPSHIIRSMIEMIEQPMLDEGFDRVEVSNG